MSPRCTSLLTALVIIVLASLASACGQQQAGYYPLDKGRWWYYQTLTTRLDDTAAQRFIVSNIGNGSFEGHKVTVQRQSSGREIYIKQSKAGIERIGVRQPYASEQAPQANTLVLPPDLSTTQNWQTTSRLRLIESRTFARQDKLRGRILDLDLSMRVAARDAEVTVAAGVFHDCVRIDGLGKRNVRTDRGNASAEITVTHSEWYAPGVGLVKIERRESSESPFLKDGVFVQELLEFE